MAVVKGKWKNVKIDDPGNIGCGNVISFEEFYESEEEVDDTQDKKHKRVQKELAMKFDKKTRKDSVLNCENDEKNEWNELGLLNEICTKVIHEKPTEIQRKCFQIVSSFKKNTLICSPTGTGKTLAYLLPILDYLIRYKINEIVGIKCLILLPTRELAIQVYKEAEVICYELNLSCGLFVGGLSDEKQMRILRQRKPSILIGTPGRIWMILNGNYKWKDEKAERQLLDFTKLKMLVVDEADKMTEQGHFEDLDNIIEFLSTTVAKLFRICVASATLSLEDKANQIEMSKITKLSSSLHVDVKSWTSIHLDNHLITPSHLIIKRIDCLDEKDRYVKLYRLVLALKSTDIHSCIIFTNTITQAKQLQRIMKNLSHDFHILHGKQQQRNRLKNLDRFINQKTTNSINILIATDVAAHGLDMSGGVDLVIHFNPPLNKESFVHRSGRTARAGRNGQAVFFQTENDRSKYTEIIKSIDKVDKIQLYDQLSNYSMAKTLMCLALDIENFNTELIKLQVNKQWFKKTAILADLVVDDDYCMPKKSNDKDLKEDDIKRQMNLIKKKIVSIFHKNQPTC